MESERDSGVGFQSEAKLKDVLKAIVGAFAHAKSSMDELSLEIAKKYQRDELLATMPPPFFALSEATVHVSLVIQRIEEHDLLVSIDPEALHKYPSHTISTIELKITPQNVKMYTLETGKVVSTSDP